MSQLIVRNLSDQLVDLVRERILSGVVPSEKPIHQDALATELGISKIPLREALSRLTQEGLLYYRANRGFFVTPLNRSEFEEIFAIRTKLEPDVMALAAERADEQDHQIASGLLADLERSTSDGGEGVGAFNRAFHLALLKPSQQPLTVNVLERMHVLSERYVRKHLEHLGREKQANDDHRQMLNAWIERDLPRIQELTMLHIRRTLDDLTHQVDVEGRSLDA